MAQAKTKEKLLLIDANSLIHRAYHALPPLTGPQGQPTGALYGLASVIIKLFKEESPQYVAAAFDRKEPTFRKEQYEAYKATRQPTPDELIVQLKEAPNLLRSFGIKSIDAPGYEADDIIATLATKFASKNLVVEIMSGDQDIFQLVKDNEIIAQVPGKGINETISYGEKGVIDKFGVPPKYIADYKGLVGDVSDNIPGVSGIGPKSAVGLIKEFGTIEKIYEHLDKIKKTKPMIATKLEEGKGDAIMSKHLATLIKDAPAPTALDDLRVDNPLRRSDVVQYMENLGFKTLLKRIEGANQEANRLF